MFHYSSDKTKRMPVPAVASDRNITLHNWFPNDSWSSLIFQTHRWSTAHKIRKNKTIWRPSSRYWDWVHARNLSRKCDEILPVSLKNTMTKWSMKPVVRHTRPLLTRHASYTRFTDRNTRYWCHWIDKNLCLENVIPNCDSTTWNHYICNNGTNCIPGNSKGKAISIQAWADPEGSNTLRLPDLKTVGT